MSLTNSFWWTPTIIYELYLSTASLQLRVLKINLPSNEIDNVGRCVFNTCTGECTIISNEHSKMQNASTAYFEPRVL